MAPVLSFSADNADSACGSLYAVAVLKCLLSLYELTNLNAAPLRNIRYEFDIYEDLAALQPDVYPRVLPARHLPSIWFTVQKILIVDDVHLVRYRLTSILQRKGYQSQAVEGNSQVAELLKRDAGIGLVLTDLTMAGLNALQILQTCQKLERYNDQGELVPPRVVLMAMPGDRSGKPTSLIRSEEAQVYGFVDVLLKPISEEALLSCVRQHLPVPAVTVANR